jgi:hypothetical protein
MSYTKRVLFCSISRMWATSCSRELPCRNALESRLKHREIHGIVYNRSLPDASPEVQLMAAPNSTKPGVDFTLPREKKTPEVIR